MSTRLSSWQADPAATRPDPSAHDTFRRHPVACCAILLVIAAVTMCWTGFDIESASARDGQSGAARFTITHVPVDVRELLDDPQRERPWPDTCANLRDIQPAGCAAESLTWPGN
jgi:hypothetical protein